MTEAERPEKVLVALITDGMENSSYEYNHAKVKALIEAQKEKGWEFLFIGANIDAIGEAGKFGISAERAVNYTPDACGTAVVYNSVNESIKSMRMDNELSHDWKHEIEKDHSDRAEKSEKKGFCEIQESREIGTRQTRSRRWFCGRIWMHLNNEERLMHETGRLWRVL